MNMIRCWVTPFATNDDMFTISMRYPMDSMVWPNLHHDEFDGQSHIQIGLFEYEELEKLHRAIGKALYGDET